MWNPLGPATSVQQLAPNPFGVGKMKDSSETAQHHHLTQLGLLTLYNSPRGRALSPFPGGGTGAQRREVHAQGSQLGTHTVGLHTVHLCGDTAVLVDCQGRLHFLPTAFL